MKKLLLLLFSILISFNSYGDWTRISKNTEGDTYYIETDTIKKHDGYVYWWVLGDFLIPFESGAMSGKVYYQGDCGVNRQKPLSYNYYKQPMGIGSSETSTPSNPEWHYPPPGTAGATIFNYVCDYVK